MVHDTCVTQFISLIKQLFPAKENEDAEETLELLMAANRLKDIEVKGRLVFR